jgi:hypothetical protein
MSACYSAACFDNRIWFGLCPLFNETLPADSHYGYFVPHHEFYFIHLWGDGLQNIILEKLQHRYIDFSCNSNINIDSHNISFDIEIENKKVCYH